MKKKILKRVNEKDILESFEKPRVTALLGARRVGKTTLLKSYMSAHPDKTWVFLNMDYRDQRLRIENSELKLMIEEVSLSRIGSGIKIWVAIDEAQKCPLLFDQVKALYDEYKDQDAIKFILTGSGHLNLHQLASESLAGRVELAHLREFNLKEMAELLHPNLTIPNSSIFDLFLQPIDENQLKNRYDDRRPFNKVLQNALSMHLVWGGLPEVLQEEKTEDRLRYLANYLQTYLENDVRSIPSISDLNLYQQLMKALAEQTGSVRDDLRLVNALGCARNTLNKYRGFLAATMQYCEIYPFINSTMKRIIKSPKGYLINNGLISYLTGIHDTHVLANTGLVGHRFENWLLNELLTWTDSKVERDTIYFWRTNHGLEVDFVVSIGAQIIPIEVTYSTHALSKKARHLKEFIEREPKAKWGIYVYNGNFQIDHSHKIIYLPAWMI